MSYNRVIPRDLFNEAKLLKCLGQLSLLIHDGVRVPSGLTLGMIDEALGFEVEQDGQTGELYSANLECFCDGRLVTLRSAYNSKAPFPLYFTCEDTSGDVFNDNGTFSDEFREALSAINSASV